MNFVQGIVRNPVFSIVLTLLVYWPALALHRRWHWIPPVVATCLPIVAFLLLVREPYTEYNRGGSYLSWWLGPATVALAVPMYRHGMTLRKSLPRLVLIVLAGSIVGMISAGLTAWLLGAPLPVVMSTVPKSVTTPIAIEVCRELKGIPQITIALVLLTGVLGASFGLPLLRLVGVQDDRAIGAAIGTSAHGIGTASLVRHSEMQATVSSWAMAVAGVFTSLLASLLMLFLH
ncbi:MAG TPA: LrgB family protein [Acidisarcina sp.]|nr:LrgB family protein [Acidisarcina sp.]